MRREVISKKKSFSFLKKLFSSLLDLLTIRNNTSSQKKNIMYVQVHAHTQTDI
jgi:hypothetical protein